MLINIPQETKSFLRYVRCDLLQLIILILYIKKAVVRHYSIKNVYREIHGFNVSMATYLFFILQMVVNNSKTKAFFKQINK